MFSESLNKHNVLLFAIRYYKHPSPTWQLFFNDMKIFTQISKSLTLFSRKKYQNVHYILNMVIKLGNRYDQVPFARLLFYHIDESSHSELLSLLEFIKRHPGNIPEMDNKIQPSEEFTRMLSTINLRTRQEVHC
jgi:hypothetical protein